MRGAKPAQSVPPIAANRPAKASSVPPLKSSPSLLKTRRVALGGQARPFWRISSSPLHLKRTRRFSRHGQGQRSQKQSSFGWIGLSASATQRIRRTSTSSLSKPATNANMPWKFSTQMSNGHVCPPAANTRLRMHLGEIRSGVSASN